MKYIKLLLPAVFLLNGLLVKGQEYLNGKIADGKSKDELVYYDRTQYKLSSNSFQSFYRVFDKRKKALYTITVTHDRAQSLFFIGIRTEGVGSKGATIGYTSTACGLIFNDISNLETNFSQSIPFNYLISFNDASLDYPILHKIKTPDGKTLDLDPLSKFRIKTHSDIIAKLPSREVATEKRRLAKMPPKTGNWMEDAKFTLNDEPDVDPLVSHLQLLRDSLYHQTTALTQLVNKLIEPVQNDGAPLIKNNHGKNDKKVYAGDKKQGKPEGKGLMVVNGSIYDGSFSAGKFISGVAIIKSDTGDYNGEFKQSDRNGTGSLQFANGGYYLGTFKNGALENGVVLSKADDGEVYFGSMKNHEKTGYGEYRTPNGDIFYGEFIKGRLVKGYAKETDQFGYATYSIIEGGTKTAIDKSIVIDFLGSLSILNPKAEPSVIQLRTEQQKN